MEPKNQYNNDTSCEQVLVLLSAYIDGALDDASSCSVAAHLASCEACRRKHALLYNLPEVMDRALPTPAPTMHDEIMASIRKHPRRRILPVYRIAASVAAVVCLFAVCFAALQGNLDAAIMPGRDAVADAPESAPPPKDNVANDSSADMEYNEPSWDEESSSSQDNCADGADIPGDAECEAPESSQPSEPNTPETDLPTQDAPPTDSEDVADSSPPDDNMSADDDAYGNLNSYPSLDSDAVEDTYVGSIPPRLEFTPSDSGSWYCSAQAYTLTFSENGTVTLRGGSLLFTGSYDITRRRIVLQAPDGEALTLSFNLGWNRLVLTTND